jgi:hypothetical protein
MMGDKNRDYTRPTGESLGLRLGAGTGIDNSNGGSVLQVNRHSFVMPSLASFGKLLFPASDPPSGQG